MDWIRRKKIWRIGIIFCLASTQFEEEKEGKERKKKVN